MPFAQHPVRFAPRRAAWCVAVVLSALPACALAEPASDPLAELLATRGELPTAPAPTPAPGLAARAADMVIAAMNFVGVPYRRGGSNSETGFDCSGFTRHIFEISLGLVLPRRADEQAGARGLVNVASGDLRPGDLVFFNTMKRAFSHVGIYVGEGRFIHSPRSGSEVRIEDMRVAYWAHRYDGARRVALADLPAAAATAPLATLN